MTEKQMTRAGIARAHVLAVDLFFRAKIEATAAAVGLAVDFASTAAELDALLDGDPRRGSDDTAALVLVDLGNSAADPPAVIRAVKARANPPIVVAFGAHEDRHALQAARDAGADRVLARSAFSQRLPELLRSVLA